MAAILRGGIKVSDDIDAARGVLSSVGDCIQRLSTKGVFHRVSAIGDLGNSGDSDRGGLDFISRFLQAHRHADHRVSRRGMMTYVECHAFVCSLRYANFGVY